MHNRGVGFVLVTADVPCGLLVRGRFLWGGVQSGREIDEEQSKESKHVQQWHQHLPCSSLYSHNSSYRVSQGTCLKIRRLAYVSSSHSNWTVAVKKVRTLDLL